MSGKKIKFALLLMLAAIAFTATTSRAASPSEVISETKYKLQFSKTISIEFAMMEGTDTLATGKILGKGSKFAIISNLSYSWYNGTDLYTYTPKKKETVVMRPNAQQLMEANPLMYLHSLSKFKVTGAKTQKPGLETVVLIPKAKGSGVKSVVVEIDKSNYMPTRFVINPTTGKSYDIIIKKLRLNSTIDNGQFNYPAGEYKGVPVIDLR